MAEQLRKLGIEDVAREHNPVAEEIVKCAQSCVNVRQLISPRTNEEKRARRHRSSTNGPADTHLCLPASSEIPTTIDHHAFALQVAHSEEQSTNDLGDSQPIVNALVDAQFSIGSEDGDAFQSEDGILRAELTNLSEYMQSLPVTLSEYMEPYSFEFSPPAQGERE